MNDPRKDDEDAIGELLTNKVDEEKGRNRGRQSRERKCYR
jgi:hypothetical protein